MPFPLLSPAGVLLSLVLLTPTAGNNQSAEVSCNGADKTTIDITKFSDMEFMSEQHEKKLYFISNVVKKPNRNVDTFQKTCKGMLTEPFKQALLGEIKTKSEYDFVANFVNTSLPAGTPGEITWAMLGIRALKERKFSALKYISTDTAFAAVFDPTNPANQAKYWATRSGDPPRYPDWHREDTCLFMDWSNATDKGRLGDGCCHHRADGYACFDTRYICQLDCSPPPPSTGSPPPSGSPPPNGSGQRSVHGGGGGGVATSTIVGCLLGLLHLVFTLHYYLYVVFDYIG